jgi:phosphoglucomutase
MTPDGLFPNVSSANPEEPKSMDRAVQLAAESPSAELVLASDPDADRMGAMAPTLERTWRYLNGNEIGALLTHFKLAQLAQQGRMPASPIVIKTLVTTGLVTRIARAFGCQVVDNLLVGFKYIADVLRQLEDTGRFEDVEGSPDDMIIAVEESHGYLTTPKIRDKDAAGASLLLAELALFQKRRGFTVIDYLEQLWREFGYFHNEIRPLVMTGILGKQQMAQMLESLRASPPKEAAGFPVTGFEDLRSEEGRMGPLQGATDAANRNMLIFHLGDKARLVLRPSGTEPKAKAYIETRCGPRAPHQTLDEWRNQCRGVDELAAMLANQFLRLVKERAGGRE